jgi:cyclase
MLGNGDMNDKNGLVELSSDVWAVVTSIIPPGDGGPNAGFVVSGDEVLVIDSLMSPECGRQLMAYLRQVTDKPPKYLINTHHHGDHSFGNQVFSPPAIIIAHEYVRTSLTTRGPEIVQIFTRKWGSLIPDIGQTQVVAPHISYKDRLTLYVGEQTVELIHFGTAHSKGDSVVYLPNDKILFSGDIFLNGIMPPIFGSSLGLIEALEQLERMDITTIIPGHGYVATKDDLIQFKHMIINLRSQIKDCFLRNMDMEQAVGALDLPDIGWASSERLSFNAYIIYRELQEEQIG